MAQNNIIATSVFNWSNNGSFGLCVSMPYGASYAHDKFKPIHTRNII